MMKNTTVQSGSDQEITLLEKASLQAMLSWYDQQIALAKKSKDLAHLKAEIAKSRFEETFAMVKLAELTAPAPQPENQAPAASSGDEKNTPVVPLQKT